jgi:hypothetical protein
MPSHEIAPCTEFYAREDRHHTSQPNDQTGPRNKIHDLRKQRSAKVHGGAPDRKKSGKLPPIRQTAFKSTPNEISVNLLNKNVNSGYDPHLTGQQ